MTLREKYGEWGIILGATEGVGKAFCERLAKEGMKCHTSYGYFVSIAAR